MAESDARQPGKVVDASFSCKTLAVVYWKLPNREPAAPCARRELPPKPFPHSSQFWDQSFHYLSVSQDVGTTGVMYGNLINDLVEGAEPVGHKSACQGIIPPYPPADQDFAFLA